MSDLISRKEAIEAIDAVFPVDPMKSEYAQGIACGAALAKTYVEQLPSTQPEIVRCKDCRYHIPHDGRCRLWCQFVDSLEWCSRAKRKDGEADDILQATDS